MSAAHVRRGASGRSKPKKSARVSVPKKLASKLPVKQAQANRLAGWAFGLFVVAIAAVALIALDVPNKVALAAGEAVGDAGFRVKSIDVRGIKRMDPRPVYELAADQKTTAASDRISLSPREHEVLAMLIDGHSNREIGQALMIGYRTVATHVENICNKLGVNSRTAAASLAVRHGLV